MRTSTSRVHAIVLFVWALHTIAIVATHAAVISYTVESVTADALADTPWAAYEDGVCSGTILPMVNAYTFHTIDYSATFYQLENASWFASPFGFLSPTPSGLCTGFCEDRTLSTLSGFYSFSSNPNNLRDGGGDWPMIGLFVYNMMLRADGMVCSQISSAGSVTVEYSGLVAVGASDFDKPLKAQVTLSQDGTIVFRYLSLPKLAPADDQIPPSVGLILTKNQRVVVEAPTESNGIVAYRFTPQLDTCPASMEQGSCLSSADCGWCSATSSCISIITQQDRCPRTQFVTSTPETPTPGHQQFYDVDMDYNGHFLEEDERWVVVNVLALYDNVQFNLYDPFPMFTTKSILSPFTDSFVQLYCLNPSIVSMNSSFVNCNPVKNTCPNGNYSMSLLMGQSSMTWSRSIPLKYLYVAPSPDCSDKAPIGRMCSVGIVVHIVGIIPLPFENMIHPPVILGYQLYVDGNGTVDMVFRSSSFSEPFVWTYPPLMMGLMRNGISDPSSVVIPPAMIQNGLHLRFTPVSACPNCGAHGYCDNATGTCECAIGFNGPTCDLCAPGFYGRNCLPCPSCVNGGTCDAGMGGSGTCTCPVGFTGPTCLQKCTKVHGDGTCSKCKSPGGRCLCGLCVCNDGYTGSSCSKVSYDPCMRYTFDGCPICGSHPGCAFCFSNVCYSPSLSGTPQGYICSYSAKSPQFLCKLNPAVWLHGRSTLFDGLFVTVVLLGVVVFCILFLIYRKGWPVNTGVRQARIHIHRYLLPRNSIITRWSVATPANNERLVVALPLCQIDLEKLELLQNEKEE